MSPYEFRLAEVDGDGALDLIALSKGALALLGSGDGGFGRPIQLVTGVQGISVTAADVDGDGVDEILLSAYDGPGPGFVEVWRIAGASTILVSHTVLAFQPGEIVASDFDGDGVVDLALLDAPFQSNALAVFHGHGDGTFTYVSTRTVGAPLRRLRCADVNGDGAVDVVGLMGATPLKKLAVLPNDGNGVFQTPIGTLIAGAASAFALGDSNGDGRLDVLAVSAPLWSGSGPTVQSLLGVGNGQFVAVQSSPSGATPSDVEFADLDGDRLLDALVVAAPGVEFVRGLGDGTFAPAQSIDGSVGVRGLEIGDLDRDGSPDAVGGLDRGVTVVHSAGLPPEPTPHGVPASVPAFALVAAEATGDAHLDVVVADGDVSVFPGLGDGTLGGPQRCAVLDGAERVAVGDLDLDSRSDLVVLAESQSSGAASLGVALGNLLGGFDPTQQVLPASSSPRDVRLVDLDGDGDLDVLAGSTQDVRAYSNRGNGLLHPVVQPALNAPGIRLAVADFDGDGASDFAATGFGPGLAVVRNAGGGRFDAPAVIFLSGSLADVVAGDLDGDGSADLVVSSQDSFGVKSGVHRLFGVGDGSFSPAVFSHRKHNPGGLALVRADHDALWDAVVAPSGTFGYTFPSGGVSVLLSRADRRPSRDLGYFMQSESIAVGDFDGDGLDDLVGGGSAAITISVHR
ncbi:MAG: VCBS repeat-containing protein [Planctomycetes bacterium]|nr:VCBS repeat-containing protein [Planctomycetota bacterium]